LKVLGLPKKIIFEEWGQKIMEECDTSTLSLFYKYMYSIQYWHESIHPELSSFGQ
jgi:hypothetical protein